MGFVDGRAAESVLRLCGGCSIAALAMLSWMPGPYMVRTGVLSGSEEHFLAYLLSAILVVAARPRLGLAWSAAFYILLAAVFELGQNFVPDRHPALVDFCAGSTGALLGAAILALMRKAYADAA